MRARARGQGCRGHPAGFFPFLDQQPVTKPVTTARRIVPGISGLSQRAVVFSLVQLGKGGKVGEAHETLAQRAALWPRG